MTLDWLDRAFLSRPPRTPPPVAGAQPTATPHPSAVSHAIDPSAESTIAGHAVVERLLEAVPTEWDSLAGAIESAVRNGRRVVAFTGGERGEGRSTVVGGVAEVLRRRGRTVAIHSQPPLLLPIDEADAARAADIVLVDAGPWFTIGPVRRRAVERAALGCDAAVLVRREDSPSCQAWADALAAIGLTVIGEALTFGSAMAAG